MVTWWRGEGIIYILCARSPWRGRRGRTASGHGRRPSERPAQGARGDIISHEASDGRDLEQIDIKMPLDTPSRLAEEIFPRFRRETNRARNNDRRRCGKLHRARVYYIYIIYVYIISSAHTYTHILYI